MARHHTTQMVMTVDLNVPKIKVHASTSDPQVVQVMQVKPGRTNSRATSNKQIHPRGESHPPIRDRQFHRRRIFWHPTTANPTIITFGCHIVNENPRLTLVMTPFLAIWICLVPLIATAYNCTDAFERISGLHAGTSVEIECSTARERIYKGTTRANEHV